MTTKEEVATPECHCPYCDYMIDSASAPYDDKARPKPGDWSICLSCAQVLVFTSTLTLRKPTIEEMLNLSVDEVEKLQTYQNAVRQLDRRNLPSTNKE